MTLWKKLFGMMKGSNKSTSTERTTQSELLDPLHSFQGHDARVNGLYIDSDGRLALTASADNTVKIWEVETATCLGVLEGHKQQVMKALFLNDQEYVLSGDSDSTIKLWDLKGGRAVWTFKGFGMNSDTVGLDISSDNRLVFVASFSGTIGILDARTGRLLHANHGFGPCLKDCMISPDWKTILLTGSNAALGLCVNKPQAKIHNLADETVSVDSVRISKDGYTAVSCSMCENAFRIWDLRKEVCSATKVLEEQNKILGKYSFSISSQPFCINSNADIAITGIAYRDNDAYIWDIDSGRRLGILNGPEKIFDACASDDGRIVATGYEFGWMNFWERQVSAQKNE